MLALRSAGAVAARRVGGVRFGGQEALAQVLRPQKQRREWRAWARLGTRNCALLAQCSRLPLELVAPCSRLAHEHELRMAFAQLALNGGTR